MLRLGLNAPLSALLQGGVLFIGSCPTIYHEHSPACLAAWLSVYPLTPRVSPLKKLLTGAPSRAICSPRPVLDICSPCGMSRRRLSLSAASLSGRRGVREQGCAGGRGGGYSWGVPKDLENNGLDIRRVRQDMSYYFGGRDFTWVWIAKCSSDVSLVCVEALDVYSPDVSPCLFTACCRSL